MEILLVLIVTIFVFDILAVRFGTDSRDLIEDTHNSDMHREQI